MYHLIFSALMIMLSVWAAIAARMAMKHGLTYSALAATVTALFILAVANAFHFVSEIGFPAIELYHVDHVVEIIAYVVFLKLMLKTVKTPLPTTN